MDGPHCGIYQLRGECVCQLQRTGGVGMTTATEQCSLFTWMLIYLRLAVKTNPCITGLYYIECMVCQIPSITCVWCFMSTCHVIIRKLLSPLSCVFADGLLVTICGATWFIISVLNVCLSFCMSDRWWLLKALTFKVHYHIFGRARGNTDQIRMWKSLGQGQDHSSKTR